MREVALVPAAPVPGVLLVVVASVSLFLVGSSSSCHPGGAFAAVVHSSGSRCQRRRRRPRPPLPISSSVAFGKDAPSSHDPQQGSRHRPGDGSGRARGPKGGSEARTGSSRRGRRGLPRRHGSGANDAAAASAAAFSSS